MCQCTNRVGGSRPVRVPRRHAEQPTPSKRWDWCVPRPGETQAVIGSLPPDRVSGIPIIRESRLFAADRPSARFQEKEKPNLRPIWSSNAMPPPRTRSAEVGHKNGPGGPAGAPAGDLSTPVLTVPLPTIAAPAEVEDRPAKSAPDFTIAVVHRVRPQANARESCDDRNVRRQTQLKCRRSQKCRHGGLGVEDPGPHFFDVRDRSLTETGSTGEGLYAGKEGSETRGNRRPFTVGYSKRRTSTGRGPSRSRVGACGRSRRPRRERHRRTGRSRGVFLPLPHRIPPRAQSLPEPTLRRCDLPPRNGALVARHGLPESDSVLLDEST